MKKGCLYFLVLLIAFIAIVMFMPTKPDAEKIVKPTQTSMAYVTPIPTKTIAPTVIVIPTPTATQKVMPTIKILNLVPSQQFAYSCDCQSNKYNCSDFVYQSEAQQCFLFCKDTTVYDDIHELDKDGDGIVCESLK